MRERAYVLIETQVGKTKEVVDGIRRLEGMASVDVVTGPYDAIAIVEAETLNEIGELITAKLHRVSGISRTVTCLVLKGS